MTNIWSTLLPCNPCHQQGCHLDHVCHGIMFGDDYTIKRPQAPEYNASSSVDNLSFPPVGYSQGTGPVDVPSGNAIGSRALPVVSPLLNQAPTLAPKNKESPWGSWYAQVNYPVSTPSTSYSDEVGRGYIDCTADINAYPSITPFVGDWRFYLRVDSAQPYIIILVHRLILFSESHLRLSLSSLSLPLIDPVILTSKGYEP
ncbi:hypothetical protein BKA83DRAFT_1184771 [Pisolithus microcarpus]|nr:hypothetical protein BKA83DRAFT_1184771 [Pisolithus microcarpus]